MEIRRREKSQTSSEKTCISSSNSNGINEEIVTSEIFEVQSTVTGNDEIALNSDFVPQKLTQKNSAKQMTQVKLKGVKRGRDGRSVYNTTQAIYDNSKVIVEQISWASEKVEEKKKILWSKVEKEILVDKNAMWPKTQVIKPFEPHKRGGGMEILISIHEKLQILKSMFHSRMIHLKRFLKNI